MEVLSLPTDFLVLLGQEFSRLVAAFAALLLARESLLGLLQVFLGSAVVAWMLHRLPVRGEEQHRQANINTRLFARQRQRLCRDRGTQHIGVPPISFA